MTDGVGAVDPNLGRVIANKFQIEAVLGHGNGGTVYRASHVQLRRPVALKVLRANLAADPAAVARFSREAQIVSQLDNPHIVHVLDQGVEPDGLTYLAMELLEGQELSRVLVRDFPLPRARVVQILSQVLSALAAAHRVGIVHRDLKPENVMLVERVGDDGRPAEFVKVMDFGIAKAYGAAAERVQQITTFGMVAGTPEYMAPEQAYGGELDGRADLYACGVVLYQMLAGAPPFTGGTPLELLNRHIHEPVVPPATRRPGADAALSAVALRALEKSRADRFPDALAMRAALLATLEEPRPAEPSAPAIELSAPTSVTLEPSAAAAPSSVVVSLGDPPATPGAKPASTASASSPGAVISHWTLDGTLPPKTVAAGAGRGAPAAMPRGRLVAALALGIAAFVAVSLGFGALLARWRHHHTPAPVTSVVVVVDAAVANAADAAVDAARTVRHVPTTPRRTTPRVATPPHRTPTRTHATTQ